MWRAGVDSGGTFTDVCLVDESSGDVRVWKVHEWLTLASAAVLAFIPTLPTDLLAFALFTAVYLSQRTARRGPEVCGSS